MQKNNLVVIFIMFCFQSCCYDFDDVEFREKVYKKNRIFTGCISKKEITKSEFGGYTKIIGYINVIDGVPVKWTYSENNALLSEMTIQEVKDLKVTNMDSVIIASYIYYDVINTKRILHHIHICVNDIIWNKVLIDKEKVKEYIKKNQIKVQSNDIYVWITDKIIDNNDGKNVVKIEYLN